MDSPEIMIAFAAVMLVIALLAVAVDWFGKPLRHRRFRPKIYRFPDERQPRRSQVRETEWSETAFVLPVVEQPVPEMLVRYPDPRQAAELAGTRALGPHHPTEPGDGGSDQASAGVVDVNPYPDVAAGTEAGEGATGTGYPDSGPPTAQVSLEELEGHTPAVGFDPGGDPLLHLVTLEDALGPDADGLLDPDHAEPESGVDHIEDLGPDGDGPTEPDIGDDARGAGPASAGSDDGRARGWKPGDYVFNLTQSGSEPAADTIRSRYWKNVASTRGTAMFGQGNTDRMAAGKPPERRNPRSGKVEVMRLPQVDYARSAGETPVPEWPSVGIDPFAPPSQ